MAGMVTLPPYAPLEGYISTSRFPSITAFFPAQARVTLYES